MVEDRTLEESRWIRNTECFFKKWSLSIYGEAFVVLQENDNLCKKFRRVLHLKYLLFSLIFLAFVRKYFLYWGKKMIYGVEKSKIKKYPYCRGYTYKISPKHLLHGKKNHWFWDTYTKKITLGTLSIPNSFKSTIWF